ncbi:hypothetical protein G039_0310230 [Pseudomonas aeruginosa VRFPA01]|nr:hypothetical protein G039_0310230 [Pseudomonas aeruginosa VRFPA01]
MADGEGATHVGHGDLGDMAVEAGAERGEQDTEQADDDARAERLRDRGGWCGRRRLGERGCATGAVGVDGVAWASGGLNEVIAAPSRGRRRPCG